MRASVVSGCAHPTQDLSMEAERQNQIIARIDDYTERQGLLRRYL